MPFKKRHEREAIRLFDASASATRAVYQGAHQMPMLEFTIKDSLGNSFIYDMTLVDASKFVQQAMDAIDAASPQRPSPRYRSPFG